MSNNIGNDNNSKNDLLLSVQDLAVQFFTVAPLPKYNLIPLGSGHSVIQKGVFFTCLHVLNVLQYAFLFVMGYGFEDYFLFLICFSPAALRSLFTISVFSHVNVGRFLPKWPLRAVSV